MRRKRATRASISDTVGLASVIGAVAKIGPQQLVTALVHCAEQIGTYVEVAASAFLALVTFARMSLAPAVQMKGLGPAL